MLSPILFTKTTKCKSPFSLLNIGDNMCLLSQGLWHVLPAICAAGTQIIFSLISPPSAMVCLLEKCETYFPNFGKCKTYFPKHKIYHPCGIFCQSSDSVLLAHKSSFILSLESEAETIWILGVSRLQKLIWNHFHFSEGTDVWLKGTTTDCVF